MCIYRIGKGPTGADRIVALDILGIMIVGLCAILTISTGRSWYIDIGIAWVLQSFISTLALAKYLEGKGFDE
ncbi:MAG: cation:proton antiporter [Candidatus Omnitrophica bacterium CG07_land_8_20_14_0_80_42_15]|uniref:Cation:proton antiporter n=1 Tax=Candidatus Aquitaenariimonas noxiae TaxID=1974741 RepID=A0A2J0KZ87_9BACT|nr:MAG: cation:proton antiporter [Candidatus Omnitrophica bacterium CG07_land_8_20_14_0_80_42_15]